MLTWPETSATTRSITAMDSDNPDYIIAVGGGGEALTASATALGVLPCMAPEMIDDPKNVGKPADIWALGAMTIELLTGSKPFGDGYKAVPLIQAAVVPALPKSIAANVQFASLASEIYDLAKACMTLDPKERISADALVTQCGKLCYSNAPRHFGTISSLDYGAYGFISPTGSGGAVFYHMKSAYTAGIKIGARVWYSKYPGNPRSRAFPVVIAVDRSSAE